MNSFNPQKDPMGLVLYHFMDEQMEAQSVGVGTQSYAVWLQEHMFVTAELSHSEITLSNVHLQVRTLFSL